MARRKTEEALVRSLTRLGSGQYVVTLPVEAVRAWRWQDRQKLQLTVDEEGKRIVIEDWKAE